MNFVVYPSQSKNMYIRLMEEFKLLLDVNSVHPVVDWRLIHVCFHWDGLQKKKKRWQAEIRDSLGGIGLKKKQEPAKMQNQSC